MDLNVLQTVFYGLLSGLMDILPVSAQAHKVLFLKFFGIRESSAVMELMIHLGIFAALFYSNQANLIRMNRARSLARIPKKKRKRPLDVRSLMDWSLVKTMCIPAILGLLLYRYTEKLEKSFVLLSVFLFINGVILYIPQFFPTGNRDSRTLSRVEGLLMGLAGAVSILPGFSAVGTSMSAASVCGVERKYSLNMVLILNMVLSAGWMVYDILDVFAGEFGYFSVGILIRYILSAAAAFGGTMLGIAAVRKITENQSFSLFGVYCWGVALFMFILNLIA